MLNLLLGFSLFLLPLFYSPYPLKYEFAKIVLFLLLSLVLVITLLFQKKAITLGKSWFFFILAVLVSILINHQLEGITGNNYRNYGLIVFTALTIWYYAFQSSQSQSNHLLKFVAFSTLLESIIILGQKLNLFLSSSPAVGTFGEPNTAAGFLLLGLPGILSLCPLAIIPVILAILSTDSVVALGALIAQISVWMLLHFKFLSLSNKRIIISVITLIIIIIGITYTFINKNVSPFENRWQIWQFGVQSFLEKPLVGHGPVGIIEAYDQQFQKVNLPLEDFVIDKAHNLWLEILLISGVFGFTFFTFWFWKNTRQVKQDWALVGIIGFLIFSFFQPFGVTHWLYLMFFLSQQD